MLKLIIKKFIPKGLLLFYHKILAYLAVLFYGWPSNKLIVVGVTGTAGKSTVVYLISKILEEAGYKVGFTNSFAFKVAEKEWPNKTKMTMPGRFFMQKILKEMVKAGCQYAIIETSSEGILQFRHLGINYDAAVFTGLHPEHIEAHGSFERYRRAKAELFKKLKAQKPKFKAKTQNLKSKKISVVNLDDENADYFLKFEADEYYGFTVKSESKTQIHPNEMNKVKIIETKDVELASDGSRFVVQGSRFKVNLLGEFNVYNVLAAITVALSQGISLEACQKTLEKIKGLPGRMEIVIEKPFKVIVDYAHTPVELEGVYQTLANLYKSTTDNTNISDIRGQISEDSRRLICVLGSAGGGRDKWKRPVLGKLAAQYCDCIILTNEDPYDENPNQILSEIKSGITNYQLLINNLYEILDRKEAIKKAIEIARKGDVVVITGKGCEPWIMGPKGIKIPWDDREVVRKFLNF